MFSILLLLMAGHVFADFFLQLTRLAVYKRKKITALAAHAFSWALVISLVLMLTGFFSIWKLFFLFATHFVIDFLKIRLFSSSLAKLHPVNITDQLLHIATILAALFYE
ncbi:DUF3307 domain-containing protein [Pelotomaculum terephthalicicum JT]|uniref:DUF3307 domain-containing protein n=1 Tax=Pelotomaculum TaxID=191373 RepID=UPI0009CBEC15|nr:MULTISPECIES: DUF3307 domain-containing protein [Pelotomaculum]MCG9969035.1 DUF3307 domain-containing protein [Pelotomaculum terephthalicicum JT]OPX92103.1 MAG: hypothetical protein A4E54_00085 [Pelotomaculum sp. PtaB.Bin117]OPY62887.1 MAG: hypothetical protein A4E56_01045 [Pelotomaculum sp. PtaU1.Bin065]